MSAKARVSGEMGKKALLGIVLEFLESITGDDRSRLPLAEGLRVTTNGLDAKLAESVVWGPARRIPYRQTFVDAEAQAAVFFGVITNTSTQHVGYGAKWWLYAVRLRIADGAIAEVEEIISENTFAHYEKMPWDLAPNAALNDVLPDDERSSREELVGAVESYWNGVERSADGYGIPFHPDAIRSECGTITTDAKNFPNSARGDFIEAKNAGWSWSVDNRRYPVIDVQRGIVVSFADLRMTDRTNPMFAPCIVAEIFKIESGLLKYLQAFFYVGQNTSSW